MSHTPDLKQQLFVIINPASARGQTGRRWQHIEVLLHQHNATFEVGWTQAPGHAVELARVAAGQGYGTVACVGGDGTLNEVVNGLMRVGHAADAESRPQLAVIPAGTGTDFARSWGLHKHVAPAVRVAINDVFKTVDVGCVRFQPDETIATTGATPRYFINVAGFGFDAEGVLLLARKGKRAGTFAYLTMVFELLRTYKNKRLVIQIDTPQHQHQLSGVFNSVVAGNGRYFGGGMKVAPHADLCDGLLDVIVVGDLSPVAFLAQFFKIYRGQHLGHPKIHFFQARALSVQAQAGHNALLEAEGELIGCAPAQISVLPRALRLKALP